jgi:hypothetical protein
LLSKLRFSSLWHRWPYSILAMLFRCFGFYCSQELLNCLSFQTLDFERTWWRSFQKCGMCTQFDIYVFITPPKVNGCSIISFISYWSVLLVEETRIPWENYQPVPQVMCCIEYILMRAGWKPTTLVTNGKWRSKRIQMQQPQNIEY